MIFLKNLWRRRLIRWFVYALIVILVLLNIALPIVFGIFTVIAPHESVGASPAGFSDIVLEASNGDSLAAWYIPPENGAVIIVIHGANGSRESVRRYIPMFTDAGFGVLAFDQRGHGASGGEINLFGWNGTDDIGAALRFLHTQADVEVIGGFGLSLGGEILLDAASTYPEIVAIVSEGATHHSYADFRSLPEKRNLLVSLSPWIMYQTVDLLTRASPPLSIVNSIASAPETQFLFIAAGRVNDEIAYNTLFLETAPHGEVWIVPDVGHIGGFDRDSESYTARVIGFFEAYLQQS